MPKIVIWNVTMHGNNFHDAMNIAIAAVVRFYGQQDNAVYIFQQ